MVGGPRTGCLDAGAEEVFDAVEDQGRVIDGINVRA